MASWEKMSTTHVSDKKLASGIYKECLKHNMTEQKMGKGSEQRLHKRRYTNEKLPHVMIINEIQWNVPKHQI